MSPVLWECSAYSSTRVSFMKKLQQLLEDLLLITFSFGFFHIYLLLYRSIVVTILLKNTQKTRSSRQY